MLKERNLLQKSRIYKERESKKHRTHRKAEMKRDAGNRDRVKERQRETMDRNFPCLCSLY